MLNVTYFKNINFVAFNSSFPTGFYCLALPWEHHCISQGRQLPQGKIHSLYPKVNEGQRIVVFWIQ